MSHALRAVRVLVLDVDGTVSPFAPERLVWGDEVVAGTVFGPVRLSPSLCQRLDRLNTIPGVACWWLTSWTTGMRAAMNPFPGRDWPVIAEPPVAGVTGRTWWKLTAVETWLPAHSEIRALAWCDDQLRGGRPAAVRRRLAGRGTEPLLLAPQAHTGLTPEHLKRLEAWAAPRAPEAARASTLSRRSDRLQHE
jgi:hypothetical protein